MSCKIEPCGAGSDCASPGTQEKEFQGFAGMVPMDRAWQDWMMSTQRREGRLAPPAKIEVEIGCWAARLGSWLLRRRERRSISGFGLSGCPARNLPADTEKRTAPPANPAPVTPVSPATNSLRLNRRYQQPVLNCFGSPPLADRAVRPAARPSFVFHSPAVVSRFHRTVPWAPAVRQGGRRTERYDGKRDLHFQHAA